MNVCSGGGTLIVPPPTFCNALIPTVQAIDDTHEDAILLYLGRGGRIMAQ